MIIAKNRPFLRKIDPAKTIGAKEANCSAVPKQQVLLFQSEVARQWDKAYWNVLH